MLTLQNSRRFAALAFALVSCWGMARTATACVPHHRQDEQTNSRATYVLEVDFGAQRSALDPQTGKHEPLPEKSPALPHAGSISPDGTRIAFVEQGKSGDEFLAVARILPDGSVDKAANVLATAERQFGDPAWLPDNRTLLFTAANQGRWQVYTIAVGDDYGSARILGDASKGSSHPRVSSQGVIAYLEVQGPEGKGSVSNVIVVEKGASRVVEAKRGIRSLQWSPDGSQLAWSETGTIAILELASGETRRIAIAGLHEKLRNHHASALAWRPDGKVIAARIVFSGGRSYGFDVNAKPEPMFGDRQVFIISLQDDPKVELFDLPADVRGLRWVAGGTNK